MATKTIFGNVDPLCATGWTLGWEREGKMHHIEGCLRETAVAIAKKNDADWCRPHVKVDNIRTVNVGY